MKRRNFLKVAISAFTIAIAQKLGDYHPAAESRLFRPAIGFIKKPDGSKVEIYTNREAWTRPKPGDIVWFFGPSNKDYPVHL